MLRPTAELTWTKQCHSLAQLSEQRRSLRHQVEQWLCDNNTWGSKHDKLQAIDDFKDGNKQGKQSTPPTTISEPAKWALPLPLQEIHETCSLRQKIRSTTRFLTTSDKSGLQEDETHWGTYKVQRTTSSNDTQRWIATGSHQHLKRQHLAQQENVCHPKWGPKVTENCASQAKWIPALPLSEHLIFEVYYRLWFLDLSNSEVSQLKLLSTIYAWTGPLWYKSKSARWLATAQWENCSRSCFTNAQYNWAVDFFTFLPACPPVLCPSLHPLPPHKCEIRSLLADPTLEG